MDCPLFDMTFEHHFSKMKSQFKFTQNQQDDKITTRCHLKPPDSGEVIMSCDGTKSRDVIMSRDIIELCGIKFNSSLCWYLTVKWEISPWTNNTETKLIKIIKWEIKPQKAK